MEKQGKSTYEADEMVGKKFLESQYQSIIAKVTEDEPPQPAEVEEVKVSKQEPAKGVEVEKVQADSQQNPEKVEDKKVVDEGESKVDPEPQESELVQFKNLAIKYKSPNDDPVTKEQSDADKSNSLNLSPQLRIKSTLAQMKASYYTNFKLDFKDVEWIITQFLDQTEGFKFCQDEDELAKSETFAQEVALLETFMHVTEYLQVNKLSYFAYRFIKEIIIDNYENKIKNLIEEDDENDDIKTRFDLFGKSYLYCLLTFDYQVGSLIEGDPKKMKDLISNLMEEHLEPDTDKQLLILSNCYLFQMLQEARPSKSISHLQEAVGMVESLPLAIQILYQIDSQFHHYGLNTAEVLQVVESMAEAKYEQFSKVTLPEPLEEAKDDLDVVIDRDEPCPALKLLWLSHKVTLTTLQLDNREESLEKINFQLAILINDPRIPEYIRLSSFDRISKTQPMAIDHDYMIPFITKIKDLVDHDNSSVEDNAAKTLQLKYSNFYMFDCLIQFHLFQKKPDCQVFLKNVRDHFHSQNDISYLFSLWYMNSAYAEQTDEVSKKQREDLISSSEKILAKYKPSKDSFIQLNFDLMQTSYKSANVESGVIESEGLEAFQKRVENINNSKFQSIIYDNILKSTVGVLSNIILIKHQNYMINEQQAQTIINNCDKLVLKYELKLNNDLRSEKCKEIYEKIIKCTTAMRQNEETRNYVESYIGYTRVRFGEKSSDHLAAMNLGMEMYKALGIYQNIIQMTNEYFEAVKHNFGEKSNEMINALFHKGDALTVQGNYQEAYQSYEKAYNLIKELMGEDNSLAMKALNSLAYMNKSMRRYEQALSNLDKAYKIALDTLGETNPGTQQLVKLREEFVAEMEKEQKQRDNLHQQIGEGRRSIWQTLAPDTPFKIGLYATTVALITAGVVVMIDKKRNQS